MEAWLAPAFADLEPVLGAREPVLLAAACRLADLGARLHPDHRADLVFDQVLRAPIAGHEPRRAGVPGRRHVRPPHRRRRPCPSRDLIARLLTHERRAARPRAGRRHPPGLRPLRPQPRAAARTPTLDIRAGRRRAAGRGSAGAPMLLGEQTAKRAATLAALLERDLKLAPAPRRRGARAKPASDGRASAGQAAAPRARRASHRHHPHPRAVEHQRQLAALQLQRVLAERLAPPAVQRRRVGLGRRWRSSRGRRRWRSAWRRRRRPRPAPSAAPSAVRPPRPAAGETGVVSRSISGA